ncbi:amino acid adenylation domain-containing protein [uncultured Algibacter sp.]|uniref:non-ribosomal peptide synthetase n=1 Tax=uncultured Algibacter sp. TaxID=298659 RepID=UPI0026044FDE|nr:amino acid adenylation domain-containing protein [uncultured Algibacter sp.]
MEVTHYNYLTQNQKLLWLGQELNPKSPMYNMVMVYEISGEVSYIHFKNAFEKLVEQNDVLRSVFDFENGEPIQKYLSNIEYEVLFEDFSNHEDPKKAYFEWQKGRVSKIFDTKKCLFDCALIKLSKEKFIWYINQHHLITDGWSTTIMLSKISDLYSQGIRNSFDDTKLYSYKAFIDIHSENSNNNKHNQNKIYWEEKVKEYPNVPSLYHKKVENLNTSSERLFVSLGNERSEKIRALAKHKDFKGWNLDLTLYNIFLTALFAYIYRVTGQEQLVIGSPTHNRVKKEFKNILGYFVETFPLFTQVDEEETFISLFKKVQIESNNFLKKAQLGTSNAKLNRSFNVFYNYINSHNSSFNEFSVKTSWVHSGHTDPRHHIRFHVHDFDNTGSIKLYFDLNTQVFDDEKRKYVPNHFLKLLDAFLNDPSIVLEHVNLITESEKSQISKWNDTVVNYPENETLLSKFRNQVLRTPNQVALVFKKTTLSYKVLDEKSNQVAHFLISKGVKNNDIIAVSLERSLEMMIFIYGIIKAGAAYLPLDANIPNERLDFILKDANINTLFYNHDKLKGTDFSGVACFGVHDIYEQIQTMCISKCEVKIEPSDLAYVIYTSGSTGSPKGVECHHEGICNRLNWMNENYLVQNDDVFIQKTPITFDVSVWELFWPLQIGSKLVVEVPDAHKNPEQLVETICRNDVTNIHFVPSMLNVFIQNEAVKRCTSLRKIFCSGEALSVPVVEKTYDKLTVEVHNLYGPTEASVDVTSWYCKKESLAKGIPIGRPVANTQLYILDKYFNQLPIGVIGELYIAGKQVAKGYLNRENLTNQRFVKDVFSSNLNARMYKTGDLVRYREDGAIEYHGRIDNQIKLRGLRIELGEIEKTIEKHPDILQAIVTTDQRDNLIAYYIGQTTNENSIVSILESYLPDYMIPSLFMHVESFKLLSSGKVDRKQLPNHNGLNANKLETSKISPRNEIEELVHAIWEEVLNIDEIGVNENFVRIGGNSLNAISITSRLKKELELDISIIDVFNYPTIETYSKHIEKTIVSLLNE